MSPVLASAPPETTAPTAPVIINRVLPKQNINSRQTLFRGKKKKMRVNPTPVKRATAKCARSKAKKASKPNSLPGYKAVYGK